LVEEMADEDKKFPVLRTTAEPQDKYSLDLELQFPGDAEEHETPQTEHLGAAAYTGADGKICDVRVPLHEIDPEYFSRPLYVDTAATVDKNESLNYMVESQVQSGNPEVQANIPRLYTELAELYPAGIPFEEHNSSISLKPWNAEERKNACVARFHDLLGENLSLEDLEAALAQDPEALDDIE
jgi:hypothetical protein